MRAYIDIETRPVNSPRLIDHISAGIREDITRDLGEVRAPSNYKDPEKIAAYEQDARRQIEESFPTRLQKALDATPLDGALGEIYCIGVAIDNEKPVIFSRREDRSAESEYRVLRTFFSYLSGANRPVLVGHNLIGFDLRFIWHRSFVLGCQPPLWFPRDPKPWDTTVDDTMVMWAGQRDRVSLSKLCLAFGIEDDDEISGADVAKCLNEGKFDLVEQHCEKDIVKVRSVHRILSFNA